MLGGGGLERGREGVGRRGRCVDGGQVGGHVDESFICGEYVARGSRKDEDRGVRLGLTGGRKLFLAGTSKGIRRGLGQ